MGQVFAAVHERMDQAVALKLLSPAAAQDPQLVARFLQEARALAQLHHPGVVRIYYSDRLDDGTVYLAMEHLPGVSLRDWMRRQPGPVPLAEALALGRQIAEVMVDIHAREIVHRDLKPENVFLCPNEHGAPGYRIKLLDFGIAKVPPALDEVRVDTQVQTVAPLFLGTATYMAPEQCRNAAEVDGRADVYALGVLLFELLAGKPPFVSDELVELISMHVRAEPPPLRDVAPTVTGALSAFIASMLAKEPAERPTMSRCHDMLGRAWDPESEECPVPGLAPFTEAQAELFFGRKAEIHELFGLLEESRTEGRRWVQIEGPSGVGKSSLVQAGLLPRLKGDLQDATRWRIANVRPSYDPLRGLASALVAAFPDGSFTRSAEEVERMLRDSPEALRELVRAHTPPGGSFLLIIEQMEELLTLGTTDCRRLDELVSRALTALDSPMRLLSTLRSDFLHRLEQMPHLSRQLNEAARYHLRPMEEAALTQVIVGMAQRAGLRLSEGLPSRMVRDSRSEGGRLPLLGDALHGLWSQRSGVLLTHERYEQLGGVGGALARRAEQVLDSLGEEGRERAKWLLLELVQVGRGVLDTRRPRTRQEAIAAAGGDESAEAVLMRLSGMRTGGTDASEAGLRLIVLSGGPDPSQQRVELVHETLLQKVPSLAGWIERERAVLERNADLEVAAHAWEQAGCPAEGLPSGAYLEHYGEPRRVSERAARFLGAAQRLAQRRIWLKRALALVALLAGAAIALSAVLAVSEQRRAEANLRNLIRATDQFVSGTDWKLSRLADTLETRRELLRDFDANLSALSPQDFEKREVRVVIIKTWHRRGDLAWHDESLARADTFLLAALDEIRRGLALQPEDAGLRFLLGLNHSKRGKIALARGRLEESREHFARALAFFEPSHEQRDDEDSRRTLATSYVEQAELELELEQTEAAARLYERAIALLERNKGGYNQALLAEALCLRGEVSRRVGDLRGAQKHLERAMVLQRSLVESAPADTLFRWILTRIHIEMAALRVAQGHDEQAAEHYRAGQALGRLLNQGDPSNKRYSLALSAALRGAEQLLRARGNRIAADQLRAELCALVKGFVGLDGEDVRFQRLACP